MLFDIHKHAEAYKAFIFKGGDKWKTILV
jgi:hypothetical protein